MTIFTYEELKDIHRDLEEFNARESWIAMEALIQTMMDVFVKRRDD